MKTISWDSPLDIYLKDAVNKFDRIVIVGWPGVGKTTSVQKLTSDHALFHTDNYFNAKGIKSNWSKVISNIIQHDKYIVEGVAAVTLLEQGLDYDHIIFVSSCHTPSKELMPLSNAVTTILNRIGLPYTHITNEIISIV